MDKQKRPPLLTDEEDSDAQMALLTKEGIEKGIYGYFPLKGERRDNCLKEAQRDADYEWHKEQVKQLKKEYQQDIDKISELHQLCISDLFQKIEGEQCHDKEDLAYRWILMSPEFWQQLIEEYP